MSPKPLKTIVFISIGVFSILSWFLLTRAAPTPKEVLKVAHLTEMYPGAPVPQQTTRSQNTLTSFPTSDFYRTIIDNNLFRPLGWRPPRPQEPYRLIGTILPKYTDAPPKAILQTTTGKKLYTVSIGEKLNADTTITDIQLKQITLSTQGKNKTLHLSTIPWLRRGYSRKREF